MLLNRKILFRQINNNIMNIVAIILARGGSKGIPKKNIVDFCGKPLISWTIKNCFNGGCSSVWVSSDSKEILDISVKYGANTILRPEKFSTDESTSECAWLHALNYIEEKDQKIDLIVAPQVTSPLREDKDIINGIEKMLESNYDSLFSCSIVEILNFWEKGKNGKFDSVNYNWRDRKRRQDSPKQYIENGSFYIFKPEILIKNNNRLGGDIGYLEMEFWKMFEIDSLDELKMCAALMKEFLIKK